MRLRTTLKNKVLVYGNYQRWKPVVQRYTEHWSFAGKKVQITDCSAESVSLSNICHQLGVLHLDQSPDDLQSSLDVYDSWSSFSAQSMGTCMIIDSCSQKSIEDAKCFISHIKASDPNHPISIGATEQYLPQAKSLKTLSVELGLEYEPLLDLDPRYKKSLKLLALSLLSEVVYCDVDHVCVLEDDFILG